MVRLLQAGLLQAGSSGVSTHRLHLVGVQEEHVAALAAHKVQGAARPASHDAHALRQLQHPLQLRLVARIELHITAALSAAGSHNHGLRAAALISPVLIQRC